MPAALEIPPYPGRENRIPQLRGVNSCSVHQVDWIGNAAQRSSEGCAFDHKVPMAQREYLTVRVVLNITPPAEPDQSAISSRRIDGHTFGADFLTSEFLGLQL